MKTAEQWFEEYPNHKGLRQYTKAVQIDAIRHCLDVFNRCESATAIKLQLEAELKNLSQKT